MAERINAQRRLWNAERAIDRVRNFVIREHLAIDVSIAVKSVTLIPASKTSKQRYPVDEASYVLGAASWTLECDHQ